MFLWRSKEDCEDGTGQTQYARRKPGAGTLGVCGLRKDVLLEVEQDADDRCMAEGKETEMKV